MAKPTPGRDVINVHINNKKKLLELVEYHHSKGRDYMSQTRMLEMLIDRDHKRLKL